MERAILFCFILGLFVFAGCTSQSSAPVKKPNVEGMTQLPSGLQYRVVKEGTGVSPAATDVVEVHYRGQFGDGQEFDSSYSRGKPASFPVNGVIKGWTEALQKMKEGSKWELCIPPDLAYGKMGIPGAIPPDSTLYFEVELLKVQKK